jgi:hypothetical protein
MDDHSVGILGALIGVARAKSIIMPLQGVAEHFTGGVGGLLFQHLANTTAVHHLFYHGNGNVTTRGGRQDVPGILCHFTHGLRATPACMGVRTGFERAHKSPSRLVWHDLCATPPNMPAERIVANAHIYIGIHDRVLAWRTSEVSGVPESRSNYEHP